MKRFIATLILAATTTAAVPAMAQCNKTQTSARTYDETVLVLMSQGTHPNSEEIRALNDVLKANGGKALEALPAHKN